MFPDGFIQFVHENGWRIVPHLQQEFIALPSPGKDYGLSLSRNALERSQGNEVFSATLSNFLVKVS